MIALYPDVYTSGKKKLTILYSKYLWEVSHRRKVKKGYEVDHIDGDKTNDILSNLQEITSRKNKEKNVLSKSTSHKNVFEDFNKFSEATKDLFYGFTFSYDVTKKMYDWSIKKFGKVVITEIAKKYNVSIYSVTSAIKRYGFVQGSLAIKSVDGKRILKYADKSLKLFNGQHNIYWITEKTGYSGYLIRKVLIKNKVPIRKFVRVNISDDEIVSCYNKLLKSNKHFSINTLCNKIGCTWNVAKARADKLKLKIPR